MNSRFRFRVWDKGNKRYQGTQDWRPYLDTDGDVCFINTDDVRDYPPENYFIVEQCTGLKDKNGNLIYEGDRVGFYVYGQDEKWYGGEGTVIWYNSSWGIETSSRFICFENSIPMANPQGIEIIGNIHEQAEQKEHFADVSKKIEQKD